VFNSKYEVIALRYSVTMKLFPILISFCVMAVPAKLLAQDDAALKTLVLYDPLFWTHELRLDPLQYQRIREINSEYYERIMEVVREQKDNQSYLRQEALRSLQHRSEKIWETFHPRQRRKWKKMWPDAESAPAEARNTASPGLTSP
jgi:hypothetical protein